MKKIIEKVINEYENIMGIKLSISQRMVFTAGYTFSLIENDLMTDKKDYSWKIFNYQTLEGLAEDYAFRFHNGQEYYIKLPELPNKIKDGGE